MNKDGLYLGLMIIVVFIGGISLYAQNKEEAPLPTENFYNKSLHFTNKGFEYLINHDGKVTLANFLSYVYKNKTMLTFAPYFSHSIKKEGRKCSECHNSPIIRAIKKNNFVLATWEKNELKNAQGVIPVLDGMKWNLVYFNYENGKWIPLQNPPDPLKNYSGFCSPLTREQFSKLEKIPVTK